MNDLVLHLQNYNTEKYLENLVNYYLFSYQGLKNIIIIKNSLKEYKEIVKKLDLLTGYLYIVKQGNDNLKEQRLIYDELLTFINKFHNYYRQITITAAIYTKENYFKLLDEYEKIKIRIIGLALTIQDIDEYFLEETFYPYVKKKLKVFTTDDTTYFGLFELENDFKLVVPPINSLKSALINVHEIRHGIDYLEGIDYQDEINDLEICAKNEEKLFVDNYIKKLVNKNNK